MTATATELMEQGIRAYTRGQLSEAQRCWNEVLSHDPGNERARSYLELLIEKPLAAPPQPPAANEAPVALPPPAAASAGRPPPTASAGPEQPVPLPPPEAPSWMAAPAPAAGPSLEDEHPELAFAAVPGFAPSPWDHGPARAPAVVLAEGDGLDLASVDEQSDLRPLVPEGGAEAAPGGRQPRSEVEVWMQGARELSALGDFSGSLEMIEKILKVDASHVEARRYLAQNEATLVAMYESKLGPAGAVPRLAIKAEEVMWLNLDHRAGFLLAQIDGTVSYEDLFALSGLPRLDTARILATLLQEGVIRS